jgi:hypothetical protein
MIPFEPTAAMMETTVIKDKDRQPTFVTDRACRDRHSTTKWILGVLVALVGVFLAAVLYAVSAANDAVQRANEVSTTLESHVAVQAQTERHLFERLDEIRSDVRENRALLQQLLRQQREP